MTVDELLELLLPIRAAGLGDARVLMRDPDTEDWDVISVDAEVIKDAVLLIADEVRLDDCEPLA